MGAGYRFRAKAGKTAEIQIYEDIGGGWFGGVTARQVADDIRGAGAVEQIDVRIASYGGDLSDGLAIYRMLAEHQARVVTHIDGVVASVASVIAMAGNEIIMAEAGSMMIHEGWTIAAGHADELRAQANVLEQQSNQMARLYADRTRQDLEKIKGWMKATTWFYGQEAVDQGFADRVAENVKAVASASPWYSAMRGRIVQQVNVQRLERPEPHPANDDIRAELAALSSRLRLHAAARRFPRRGAQA